MKIYVLHLNAAPARQSEISHNIFRTPYCALFNHQSAGNFDKKKTHDPSQRVTGDWKSRYVLLIFGNLCASRLTEICFTKIMLVGE